MNTRVSCAIFAASALVLSPLVAHAQLSYVSQSRSVNAQGSSIAAPGFAPFNQSLDQTAELFPGTGWFVNGRSSQNSTLGPSQIRFSASNNTSGAFFTGGGQVTGGNARFTFDVTFDLNINSQVSLLGANSAFTNPNLPSASAQTLRLTRVSNGTTVFERVLDPNNPSGTSGHINFITNLTADRYRLFAEGLTSSSGSSFFGSINPNSGSMNFIFTVPTPGVVAPALLAGAMLATRRRRA